MFHNQRKAAQLKSLLCLAGWTPATQETPGEVPADDTTGEQPAA